MVSKRRDDLRDYMGDEFEFIATIETSDYKRRRMVITDVAMLNGDGGFTVLATHLHLRNVDDKILLRLTIGDVIIFKAIACSYDTRTGGGRFKNFALENVRCIRKIGGKYNGRK